MERTDNTGQRVVTAQREKQEMEIRGLGKAGKQQAQDGSWGMGVLAIYNPQRRSKSGNRFGFVRFRDVKWVKELESQLDQIWIEGRKLWVNVAKYPEEKSEKVERRRVSGIATVVQGKTYADAVKGQQVDKPREARGHEFVARANTDLEKHHSRRNPKQQESK
ncbi:hypothetical protein SLEP1_g36357 [Rubroshorea leprosula]|uniref:RRM domain-containing protein n=1 Tax=Rubroshorea leprosula TaxID=152421 RepID=A0AAV5KR94_9ROSI|nr:hypothetical protein SLEP1_g36357 [Rubroshorea leprosula]